MQLNDHIVSVDPNITAGHNVGIAASYRIEHHVLNQSRKSIAMIDVNNVITVLEPEDINPTGVVVVQTVYRFTNHRAISATIDLNEHQLYRHAQPGHHDSSLDELKKVLHALRAYVKSSLHKVYEAVVTVERKIPIHLLEEKGWVYLENENVVLTDLATTGIVYHPYSHKSNLESHSAALNKDIDVTGMNICVVDNEGRSPNYYIWMGKEILTIPARKDPKRKSGVYLYTAAQQNTITGKNANSTKHTTLTFEQAKELIGLYSTKEEVSQLADPDNQHRLEEQRLRNEEQRLKNENVDLARQKMEAEKELERLRQELQKTQAQASILENDLRMKKTAAEKEAAKEKRKAEKAKAETDRARNEYDARSAQRKDVFEERKARRDDHYEGVSHGRKDSSEGLKFAAWVAAAAMGIGVAAWKFMSGPASIFAEPLFSSTSVSDFASSCCSSACNFAKSTIDTVTSFGSRVYSGFCGLFS